MTSGFAAPMITCGFRDKAGGVSMAFAEVSQNRNGTFNGSDGIIEYDRVTKRGRKWGMTLQEAVDWMDAWERAMATRTDLDEPVRDFGLKQRNFRDAAREMGIAAGPEEKSLQHAARMKRAAMGRRRGAGPGC